MTFNLNFNLPNQEWASVLKGALIAGVGVALTYVSQNLSGADFGAYGPVVVGVVSVLVNYLRKVVAPQDVTTQVATTTTTTVPVDTIPVETSVVEFEEKK